MNNNNNGRRQLHRPPQGSGEPGQTDEIALYKDAGGIQLHAITVSREQTIVSSGILKLEIG